jgi:hypothetical protein
MSRCQEFDEVRVLLVTHGLHPHFLGLLRKNEAYSKLNQQSVKHIVEQFQVINLTNAYFPWWAQWEMEYFRSP